MPRSRLSAALYLLLVFASGILVGLSVQRLYSAATASANTALSPEQWRKRYLDEMKKRVGASDDQLAKAGQIMDRTKRRFDEVHVQEKQTHDQLYQQQLAELKALLSDEQQVKFDAWRAERQREREKAKQKK